MTPIDVGGSPDTGFIEILFEKWLKTKQIFE
jgi:hypothetical protein